MFRPRRRGVLIRKSTDWPGYGRRARGRWRSGRR
jgi:hypothetical protein